MERTRAGVLNPNLAPPSLYSINTQSRSNFSPIKHGNNDFPLMPLYGEIPARSKIVAEMSIVEAKSFELCTFSH